MQPTCPRCGSPGTPKQGREYINHEEHLDYTHVCSNQDCVGYFRYEPGTLALAAEPLLTAATIDASLITTGTLGEVEEEIEADEPLPTREVA